MFNIIESVRMRLKRRIGCFGLYGYDFMIDEEMKVWLIEINVNPALTTNTNTLIQTIPPVVREGIGKVKWFVHFIFDLVVCFLQVIAIECFEKLRHGQKLFPLKAVKGFKCIYNELERKGSLPYIEQRRATSTSPNTRKIPAAAAAALSPKNSVNSPKTLPKCNEQQQQQSSVVTKSPLSNVKNVKINRSSDTFFSSLPRTNHCSSSNNSETMLMKYQTIQRYKSNFELLKPATVIAEEWKNLDRTQKDRLAIGGGKALVLVSKSSTPTKHLRAIPT